ncbi:hypothetical protein GUITHDRAFT_154772, partial [Guillardia theta CCMP2712]
MRSRNKRPRSIYKDLLHFAAVFISALVVSSFYAYMISRTFGNTYKLETEELEIILRTYRSSQEISGEPNTVPRTSENGNQLPSSLPPSQNEVKKAEITVPQAYQVPPSLGPIKHVQQAYQVPPSLAPIKHVQQAYQVPPSLGPIKHVQQAYQVPPSLGPIKHVQQAYQVPPSLGPIKHVQQAYQVPPSLAPIMYEAKKPPTIEPRRAGL